MPQARVGSLLTTRVVRVLVFLIAAATFGGSARADYYLTKALNDAANPNINIEFSSASVTSQTTMSGTTYTFSLNGDFIASPDTMMMINTAGNPNPPGPYPPSTYMGTISVSMTFDTNPAVQPPQTTGPFLSGSEIINGSLTETASGLGTIFSSNTPLSFEEFPAGTTGGINYWFAFEENGSFYSEDGHIVGALVVPQPSTTNLEVKEFDEAAVPLPSAAAGGLVLLSGVSGLGLLRRFRAKSVRNLA